MGVLASVGRRSAGTSSAFRELVARPARGEISTAGWRFSGFIQRLQSKSKYFIPLSAMVLLFTEIVTAHSNTERVETIQ